jgi:group I intron endonuclease
MTCGVYQIHNLQTKKVHVGSSVEIEERWRTHRRRLNRGDHHSAKLQASWAKWGENQFVLEVLEELPHLNDTLVAREQWWIDNLNAYVAGYNMRPKAESCLGLKRPAFSEEHRRRIADAKKGALNPNHGKPRGEETRKKIADSNQGLVRSEATRKAVSASRIRYGDVRYAGFAEEQRGNTLRLARERGEARLAQEFQQARATWALLLKTRGGGGGL